MRSLAVAALALAILGLCARAADAAPGMLFPDAAKVRVVGAPGSFELAVDQSGQVTAKGPSKDGGDPDAYPVKDGGMLSPAEVSRLRASVRFTRPPKIVLRCCLPRHAFLFYDRSGRYLGYLKVCFECACAEMEPFNPPDKDRNWISWNYERVKKIALAHDLGPIKPLR
jgi:hypothetical protein